MRIVGNYTLAALALVLVFALISASLTSLGIPMTREKWLLAATDKLRLCACNGEQMSLDK